MKSSAATAVPLVPARRGALAARIGRRWRIAALAAVAISVAVVMLTGGHRPAMGLTGRGSSVVSVAFSPDSKIIAAADEEGFIYLWQTATGQRITTLRNPRDDLDAYQPTSTPARTYLWDVSWLP
jgi:WD40 repeat protein